VAAGWPVLVHSARTAIAALASLLGSAVIPAAGSVLGADYDAGNYVVVAGRGAGGFLAAFRGNAARGGAGAIAASYFGPRMVVFAASVFVLGVLSALVQRDRSAYRFGGVTLAIVLLIPRAGPVWQVALHRFAEVSIGIAVALVLTVVWPEREETLLIKKENSSQGSSARSS
jgi:Fusaric acid resistance protein-like